MPRNSPVGQAIFDEVEELRRNDPSMTQQKAFAILAEREPEGRSMATIAANYYRIARNMKAQSRPKKKRRQRDRAKTPVAAVAPVVSEVEPIDLDKLEAELTETTARVVAAIRITKERLDQVSALEQRVEQEQERVERMRQALA